MPDQRGNNEGFRVLEEFVCQAIPGPTLTVAGTATVPTANGKNQGLHLLQEVVVAAGGPETREAARERLESLPRSLIHLAFYARAIELGRQLPVTLSDLDLAEQGGNGAVRIVSRYLMARELNLQRPSEVRSTFLIDLAILMTELARPHGVFLAEARKSAIEVASRLLRYEGWSPAASAYAEWETKTLAVEPAGPDAAKQYLALMRGHWGWVGPGVGSGLNEAELAKAVVIPESIMANLTRHST